MISHSKQLCDSYQHMKLNTPLQYIGLQAQVHILLYAHFSEFYPSFMRACLAAFLGLSKKYKGHMGSSNHGLLWSLKWNMGPGENYQ